VTQNDEYITASEDIRSLIKVAYHEFKVGDIILYGKYKNKRGKIVAFGVDDRGHDTIEIEPIPKGRKQNKQLSLFRIWPVVAEAPVPVVAGGDAAYKSKKKVKNKDGEEVTVYEYSEKHVEKRTKEKVDKINHLKDSIDKVVSQAKKDLKSDDLKVRLPALATLLIDHTYERVGNEGSASEGHYGVTTWKKKHVSFSGKKAILTYVGKSGVDHKKEVTDATLVSALKELAKGKGDNDYLFCDKEEECSIRASEVNEYLKQFDITSKDLRGYHANRVMQEKLKAVKPAEDEKERKRQFLDALEEAAEEVGHEASTLRSQYLAPSIEKDFMDDGKVNNSVRASERLAFLLASVEHIKLAVNQYLNTPPTELADKIKSEKDPKKKREMQEALNAWRGSHQGPLTPEKGPYPPAYTPGPGNGGEGGAGGGGGTGGATGSVSRAAADVGTDTATIWAISPEGLYRVLNDGEMKGLMDSFWGVGAAGSYDDVWPEMEDIVRQHGGATFHTKCDGVFDVKVDGAEEAGAFAIMGKTAATNRKACIIAAGFFGSDFCMLKNRDRNYVPKVKLIHEIRNGVEVLYIEDVLTGWCEGLNEHGIGIVNTALLVKQDEQEGRPQKTKKPVKRRDGDRILEALESKDVAAAVKSIKDHDGGLPGHTFVSDGRRTYSVEMSVDEHDPVVRYLDRFDLHVRTNHGFEHPDAGYVAGPDYESSTTRYEKAMETLSYVSSPQDIAPSLVRERMADRAHPNNMVRDTDNMKTTSQMVLNLTWKELIFYVIPGKVEFVGFENRLDEGYEPKLSAKVFRYLEEGDNYSSHVVPGP
jgi:DNA topoisomerase-1